MPTQLLTSSYKIVDNLALSIQEFKEVYLFGIPLRDALGNKLPDSSLETWIRNASDYVERLLSVKLKKQVITEEGNFNWQSVVRNYFVRATYPVLEGVNISGNINDISQIIFPREWMVTKRAASGKVPARYLHLLPSKENGKVSTIVSGTFAINYLSNSLSSPNRRVNTFYPDNIPSYWDFSYVTPGFGNDPAIKRLVGKIASVDVFNIIGESVGVGTAIAARSISVDGLSQSVQTTSSATSSTFGALITNLKAEIKEEEKVLKSFYKGAGVYATN